MYVFPNIYLFLRKKKGQEKKANELYYCSWETIATSTWFPFTLPIGELGSWMASFTCISLHQGIWISCLEFYFPRVPAGAHMQVFPFTITMVGEEDFSPFPTVVLIAVQETSLSLILLNFSVSLFHLLFVSFLHLLTCIYIVWVTPPTHTHFWTKPVLPSALILLKIKQKR
jgi:hypothetical protein